MPRERISEPYREILAMEFHRKILALNFVMEFCRRSSRENFMGGICFIISQQNFATEFCLKIPPQTEKARNFISEIPRGIFIRGLQAEFRLSFRLKG
ncbi:hypothetical protein [uncultured Campylobacter sp.]|uniref:hypothetical protein n=1 Tax=uncultured Campylobacter sp. TaxID=218934 RepID=UPI0026078E6D|nr:hypothetical protein [uncultured Campylobacter sp.]